MEKTKKCKGPCGRELPLAAFGYLSDGLWCQECRGAGYRKEIVSIHDILPVGTRAEIIARDATQVTLRRTDGVIVKVPVAMFQRMSKKIRRP